MGLINTQLNLTRGFTSVLLPQHPAPPLAGQPGPLPALFPARQSSALLDCPSLILFLDGYMGNEGYGLEESNQGQWIHKPSSND